MGAKIPGYSKHIEWRMLFLAMEGVICLLRYTQIKNIRVVQVNNGELYDGFVIPGPKVCHGFHDAMKTFPFRETTCLPSDHSGLVMQMKIWESFILG